MEHNLLKDYIEIYWKTIKNIDSLIAVPMKEFKISFEQFMIMRDLIAGKKLAVSEIARDRNVTRAAISRQIKTLLDLNYITQERDQSDRRILYLRLTETGEDIAKEVNNRIIQRFDHWVNLIGQDDAHELLRIMRKIGKLIIADDPEVIGN